MKTSIASLVMLTFGLPWLYAQQLPAQPPPAAENPQVETGRGPMHNAPPAAGHNEHMQAMFVDRLLTAIREKNPAEADRLQQLRESDPEAFRQELRTKVIEYRRTPPPGMTRHEAAGEGDTPRRELRREGDRPEGRPEFPEFQEIRTLAQQYRGAASDEEKQKIRLQLRDTVMRSFDERQKFRRERIARFEKELEAMKKDLEKIDADRESFVDRRIGEILRDPPTTPAAPPANSPN